MFSLWQETTDLLFRTNLGEDSRVEELAHLSHIAFALTVELHKRRKPRSALEKLGGTLRTLMPREWFHDEATRELVRTAIGDANPEVTDLYLASVLPVPD